MKLYRIAQKYGAKIVAATGATIGTGLALAQQAQDPVAQIFAAINLGTVAAAVIALGVLVIGITMAFKGIDLGKRGVKKA